MKCPDCGLEIPPGAPECAGCGLIPSKWEAVQERRRQAAASGAPRAADAGFDSNLPAEPPRVLSFLARLFPPDRRLAIAGAAAAAVAAACTRYFAEWMPITDGWARYETWFFPLSFADVAFHEAGHWVFGVSGSEWLTVAGGTLMQLLIPSACLVHLALGRSRGGILFCLFWIGLNCAEISWYAADAKMQALILITGMSGREGGMHDWGWMLGRLGLVNRSVGIGEAFFFAGCFLMAFAPGYGLARLWPASAAPTAEP